MKDETACSVSSRLSGVSALSTTEQEKGRRVMKCGAGIVLLAVVCGCGGPKELQRVTPDSVVLAFGDSLTAGTGAADEESYPAVLSKRLGCRVINAGIPGEITEEGTARLPALLRQHKPQLVILCHGGNDMLRKIDDMTLTRHLRMMIAASQATGADVVLLGVPRPGLILKAPAFYGELAHEYGVPYEGQSLPEILSSSTLKSDMFHPNAAGYLKLAERLTVLIKQHAQ